MLHHHGSGPPAELSMGGCQQRVTLAQLKVVSERRRRGLLADWLPGAWSTSPSDGRDAAHGRLTGAGMAAACQGCLTERLITEATSWTAAPGRGRRHGAQDAVLGGPQSPVDESFSLAGSVGTIGSLRYVWSAERCLMYAGC